MSIIKKSNTKTKFIAVIFLLAPMLVCAETNFIFRGTVNLRNVHPWDNPQVHCIAAIANPREHAGGYWLRLPPFIGYRNSLYEATGDFSMDWEITSSEADAYRMQQGTRAYTEGDEDKYECYVLFKRPSNYNPRYSDVNCATCYETPNDVRARGESVVGTMGVIAE